MSPPPPPTRPRLQAINQTFTGLDEQLRQATRIIGLPDDWDSLPGHARAQRARPVVRARADWVLRWVLEKLKEPGHVGAQARASSSAWALLDCMVNTLPVSRAAPHLRDADFPTILEKALEEAFGACATVHQGHARHPDATETAQDDQHPSRKRKRRSAAASPSKRVAVDSTASVALFDTIRATVRSVRDKADAPAAGEERVQAEHMKMVLRTETAQAARILKNWLTAIQYISDNERDTLPETGCCDLAMAVELWELRAIDSKDHSGASVEHFSSECLIPTLLLSQTLHALTTGTIGHSDSSIAAKSCLVLDRLIAKHVLIPSRAAFFAASSVESVAKDGRPVKPADLLSTSLAPLTDELLQTARFQGNDVHQPAHFALLFAAVPHLLDLVVRSSPARTPKARTAENPWIQASLVTLAQSVGCALSPPELATPTVSITALEQCLAVLKFHNVNIDARLLRDLFWFHSGFKYPPDPEKVVHWSLIAAIVEIDSSVFLADPNPTNPPSDERPNDLLAFLFEQISIFEFGGPNAMQEDHVHQEMVPGKGISSKSVVQKIIVPIVHACSRNRQLPGFIERWESELRKIPLAKRWTSVDDQTCVWENCDLTMVLSEVLERSLTLAQITNLYKSYAERLDRYTHKCPQKALSSAVIIQAMLYATKSEQTIESLLPTLLAVWRTLAAWVQVEDLKQLAVLPVAWTSLSLLLGHLWPIYLHKSAILQKELLRPLLDRASRQIASAREENSDRDLHSTCRAAAVVFALSACDLLSTIPDSTEFVEQKLQIIMETFCLDRMDDEKLMPVLELFCVEYVHLLRCCGAQPAQKVLSQLVGAISRLPVDSSRSLMEALSGSIFHQDGINVVSAFVSVILEGLGNEDDNLRTVCIHALLQVCPTSLLREQREAVLDRSQSLLLSNPNLAAPLLKIMMHLMQVPNATAGISSDGNALFDIAQALRGAKTGIAFQSPPIHNLLQGLVRLTLGHLIPNRDQAQNKIFFDRYREKVGKSYKTTEICSPAILAVLSGTFLAAREWGILLPFNEFVSYLSEALSTWSSAFEIILEAFNQIPMGLFESEPTLFKASQTSLRQWISVENFLDNTDHPRLDTIATDTWPSLFIAVNRYQLYPDIQWVLRIASQLLRLGVSEGPILWGIREALESLSDSKKMDLVDGCSSLIEQYGAKVAFHTLHATVSSLDDKAHIGLEATARRLALLPQLCSLLGEAQNDTIFNMLLNNVNHIILHKPNMVSQHSVESLLTVLHKLSSRSSPHLSPAYSSPIYTRLCETTRMLLLLQHGRSRLGGRFHILLPLLQNLLLCLFIPNLNRGAALPPWLITSSSNTLPSRLSPANAAHFAHLLSTLCSPTQSSVQKTRSATTLNDPIKAAREYASQYVYPLLSSFCRFTLYGRLDAEVRDKLMPGIWEVVSVAQLNKDAIDAMFAGLGKSERDVWRSVWGEWVRVHGRKEKKGMREE